MPEAPSPRPGAVDLSDSPEFLGIAGRLEHSRQIVEAIQARGDFPLDQLLTEALNTIVASSGLDGMMIASDDGLVVAESRDVAVADILGAIGCLFESIVNRAQGEGLIAAVEEMTLRGFAGEQIIVRYLPQAGHRFVLIAYSRGQCAHRRATTRALKQCGTLLAMATLPHQPAKRRKKAPPSGG